MVLVFSWLTVAPQFELMGELRVSGDPDLSMYLGFSKPLLTEVTQFDVGASHALPVLNLNLEDVGE